MNDSEIDDMKDQIEKEKDEEPEEEQDSNFGV